MGKPQTLKPLFRYFIMFIFAAAAMTGCGDSGVDEPEGPYKPPIVKPDPEPENLEFTSFSFKRADNPLQLTSNFECTINGDEITALLRSASDLNALTPSFEGDFDKVWVGDEEQVSGKTVRDFTKPVSYTLTDPNGYQRTYRVVVKMRAGLPMMKITTEKAVDSKTEFVEGTMAVSNTPEYGGDRLDGIRIRGRGNATWSYEKKPYRIKLDKKESLFGFPEHRDWALLAEYCDKSLLRNSYLWEMSKIAGLEWTCRSKHIELWLNGEYLGTYLFCENVKEGKGRADVEPGGFLVERDNYWNHEPLWFGTNRGTYYTFKYPDPDGEIARGDDNFNYISGFMNQLETALYGGSFADPKNGYRKYIDAESFARWYLVQEVLGNIDTNPYYVLKKRGGKLEMYPPWDAEWCLGIAAVNDHGWIGPPFTSPVDKLYWKNNGYFSRLTQDPWFCDLLRTEWAAMKERMPELEANIAAIVNDLQYAQAYNFERWNVLGRYVSAGLLNFATWRQEVDFAADFLSRHVAWLDERIQSFPN